MRGALGRALALPGRHPGATALCLLTLIFLCVLLPLHLTMAYRPVRERNARQLEAISRRADLRPEGFSFAVLGESRDSRRVFEGILKNLNGDDASFCVHLGDGVHSADLTSYAYFLRQLEIYGRPVLLAAGPEELRDGGEEIFREVFGDTCYSFTAGGCLMVFLDDRGGEGPGEEQLAWLRGELEKGREMSCRLVFMHHPLFDPAGAEEGYALRDRAAAEETRDLLLQGGVDMVFASHAPGYYQGDWGGLRYAVTGGGGARIERRDDTHRFYNFLKVSVSGGLVDVEVVKTPGPSSEGWDRAAFTWSLHAYGFFAVWFWWDMVLLAAAVLLGASLWEAARRARRGGGNAAEGPGDVDASAEGPAAEGPRAGGAGA